MSRIVNLILLNKYKILTMVFTVTERRSISGFLSVTKNKIIKYNKFSGKHMWFYHW